MGRTALHRRGFPARVLPPLPRLRSVLSAARHGAVSQSDAREYEAGGLRVLKPLYGVVVGLVSEARIAKRLGWPVAIGGGGSDGAAEAARRLVESGTAG